METCDTCKWWKPEERTDEPRLHPCSHEESDNGSDYSFSSVDGEPYNGGRFASGPKFGCIHWEAKDQKECNCPQNCCYEEDLNPSFKCRNKA